MQTTAVLIERVLSEVDWDRVGRQGPEQPVADGGLVDVGHEASPAVVAGAPVKDIPAVVSRHKPFVEKDCKSCHSGAGEMAVNALNSSCVACHKETPTQHRVMHEPVANGQCLWCHAPHEATQTRLLRARSAELCIQCHERTLLTKNVAEHVSEKADCMSCHVSHGGADRNLLREGRAVGILKSGNLAGKDVREVGASPPKEGG